MAIYRNVLVAIDLHPACDTVILQHAHALVQGGGAILSVIHAIEHINAYGVAQAYPAVINLEAEMRAEAQKQLREMVKRFDVPESRQHVDVGSPKVVILDKLKELKADLIVIGSHGRHGVGLLFGSTATAVIHHLSCDALIVKIPDSE